MNALAQLRNVPYTFYHRTKDKHLIHRFYITGTRLNKGVFALQQACLVVRTMRQSLSSSYAPSRSSPTPSYFFIWGPLEIFSNALSVRVFRQCPT